MNRTAFFSLLSATILIAGCDSSWPSGHVCDQELPLTFAGMLGLGIPNDTGGFSPLIGQACSQHDFDDDDIPAGGDVNDAVDEYDWDLEGEDEGWAGPCVYKPPGSYGNPSPPGEWGYEYDGGCRSYWKERLVDACARWDAGELQAYVAESDMGLEEEAYAAYCWAVE